MNQAIADAYGTSVESLLGKTDSDFNPDRQQVEGFRNDDLEVINTLEQLFEPFGRELFVTASIGIKYSSNGEEQPEDLLRDADTAMYCAKALGKAQYQEFDARMHSHALTLLELESDLRRAIDRDEFQVNYQPIVSLDNGRICGFEALVRWLHPERGMISPADFIPIAEETGLIIPIGRWVLKHACQQMHRWHEELSVTRQMKISVNLSSKQFMQPRSSSRCWRP